MNTNNAWLNMAALYIRWLLVTAIAFSLIAAVAFFLTDVGESGFFLIIFTAVPIWVIALGIIQARLLRQKLGGTILWICVVACYVAIIAVPLNFNESSSSIPAFIAGTALGTAQFFILRKQAPGAIWWIPASMMAWSISYLVGLRIFSIFGGGLYLIAVGLVNGIVTGVPYTISFSKSNLQIPEKIGLATISMFLLVTIWLSTNAGLSSPDSAFVVSFTPKLLSFSPDGKILAIASSEGIEFRDTDSWKTMGSVSFKSKDRYIYEMNFSPDGQTVAVAICCDDNVIELWDVANFQYIGSLRGHAGDVYTVAFSPDGKLLASGGRGDEPDAQAIIWDFNSQKFLRIVDFSQEYGGNRGVQRVEFSPDGKTLAASIPWGAGAARVVLLDVASGKTIRQIEGFYDPFFKASFSKDWSQIAGASEKSIKIIDVSSGKELRSLPMASEYFLFSMIPPALAETSGENMIRVWDVDKGIIVAKLFPSSYRFTISPDGKWIASADPGCQFLCTLQIWNLGKYIP